MLTEDFTRRLSDANERIQRGNEEVTAGADARAQIIAEEVELRGYGGARRLAEDLGVSDKTISQAVTRAKQGSDPLPRLPLNTLERLLAIELSGVPVLSEPQWGVLESLLRNTFIDVAWIEEPGHLLALEVEDAVHDQGVSSVLGIETLPATCRGWTRTQALAVIDACLRGDIAALPSTP